MLALSLPIYDPGDLSGLRRMIQLADEHAMDGVEVVMRRTSALVGPQLDPAVIEAIRAEIGPRRACFVHAPHAINPLAASEREHHLATAMAAIEAIAALGGRRAVFHPGRARTIAEDDREAEVTFWRLVGDQARQHGITVCLENLPDHGQGKVSNGFRMTDLAEMTDAIDHPSVAITLDTSHLYISVEGDDRAFLEQVSAAGSRLRHIHAHDSFGIPEHDTEISAGDRLSLGIGDLHLPPGRGNIPWHGLAESLSMTDVSMVLELHERHLHDVGEAVATLRRFWPRVAGPATARIPEQG